MITNRIDLTGALCNGDICSELLFSDVTGFLVSDCLATQNDLGYGLVGGITLNSVETAQLNVYFISMTTPITFDFTIVSGVITACFLTDLSLVSHDITPLLVSTVFPLTDFNINFDYGVTIPAVVDGLYTWDYTITGTSGSDVFTYTTSGGMLSTCSTDCCIEKSYLELDTNCGCLSDKIKDIIKTEVFLAAANYAMNAGQTAKADDLLTKAKDICTSNCKDC
jgi:hypothetical protein